MKRIRTLLGSVLLPLIALAAAGCSKDSTSPTAPAAESIVQAPIREVEPSSFWSRFAFGISGVMFVHASPDAPAVDIKLGALPAARGLEYGANTPYRFTLSGPRAIQVNVAGTSTTVISARPTLARRTFYTVWAANQVAGLEPVVTVDDLTPPANGLAHARFVHLSPNAPAVDVALAGGAVVWGNASFKDATAFTPLPAGTYDLEVRLAGTSTVVLPLPGIRLERGRIYTFYAKGLVGGTGAQALGAGAILNWPGFGYFSGSRAVEAAESDLLSGESTTL